MFAQWTLLSGSFTKERCDACSTTTYTLTSKCCHFDEIVVSSCSRSCHKSTLGRVVTLPDRPRSVNKSDVDPIFNTSWGSQDARLVQIWWSKPKSVTNYPTNNHNFLEFGVNMAKMTLKGIFNNSPEHSRLFVWCTFDDSISKQVIVQTR